MLKDNFVHFSIKTYVIGTHNVCCVFYGEIISTPQHYTYFAQFDWLEKKFYTSINSMSINLGTIFHHYAIMLAKIFMTKLELYKE